MNTPIHFLMDEVFPWMLEASVYASLLTLLIGLLLRRFGSRMSYCNHGLLWAMVPLALMMPVALEWSVPWTLPGSIAFVKDLNLGGIAPLPPAQNVLLSSAGHSLEPAGQMALNPPPINSPLAMLALAWLAGTFLMLGRLLLGRFFFARDHVRAGVCRDSRVLSVLEECRTTVGVTKMVKIQHCTLIRSPAILGWFRPVILMPKDLSSRSSRGTLRHIFLHELVHIHRRDHQLNGLLALLAILHWFNPILHYAFRRLRLAREQACDESVLRLTGARDGSAYGSTLLNLFELITLQQPRPFLVPVLQGKQQLQERIRAISNFDLKNPLTTRLGNLLFLAVLLAAVTRVAGTAEDNAGTLAAGPRHAIAVETYPPDYPGGILQPGDSIEIVEVLGSGPDLASSGELLVKGKYTLKSRDKALIALYATGGVLGGTGNRTKIEGGEGAFMLQGTLKEPGALHVSFYPIAGGEGFGGIYFRDRKDQPAPGSPAIPVPFRTGRPAWEKASSGSGDAVEITRVTGTSAHFEEGGVYTFEGNYTLISQDSAQLIFYATNGATESISYAEPNGLFIAGGTGAFRLTARIVKAGMPHISMYPVEGGKGFLSRYIVAADGMAVPDYIKLDEARPAGTGSSTE